jgi:protein-tyrosine phosphatase
VKANTRLEFDEDRKVPRSALIAQLHRGRNCSVALKTHNTILFLCTGNYYRSRFAEIYFNWHAVQRSLDWRAESRGLAIDSANPGFMSRYTVGRLKTLNIPHDDYQRFPLDLSHADLHAADKIVAVKEREHRPLLHKRFPQWLEKTEFWSVHDIDCATPEEALPHLEANLAQLLDRLESITVPAPNPSRPTFKVRH